MPINDANINERDTVRGVKSQMENIKGVIGVAELTSAQCNTLSCIEEEAMQHILGGIGRGRNEGLKKSLSYSKVFGIFVDASFKLTNDLKSELMQLINDDEVVGFGTQDPIVIDKYKQDKGYVVLSDFLVMKRSARINRATFCSGKTYFLFKGIKNEQLARIEKIKDHFVSIPSAPVFNFLKEQFKDTIDLTNPQAAIFIVGFELR